MRPDHPPRGGGSVVFSRVTKSFGDHRALDDVSFALRPGKVTGLLGPNGAGKSTLLRILLGLARPDSGSADVLGGEPLSAPERAQRVGVVMDAIGFPPRVTVRRQLEISARSLGLPGSRIADVIAQVGLEGAERKRVKACSTGMRQRLALAVALLPDPELLILDEPLNGLDPDGIRWMRRLVERSAAEGRTVLIASHMLSEVEQSVDDVVVLRRSVLFTGSLQELVRRGGGRLEDAYFALVEGADDAAPRSEVTRA
ncbi:putative ABC transporter ATP-binding protein YxlF [Streptomyces sp. ADI96-02]|uniref:ABC transporter ATP-binding protein n=1 Tax=Streptomyces sp. ADI96-02 TaxID=1522760 RepID=UPI000FAB2D59|nr:ATP-binding cassette domain-containing protein [Streptomyces sp. ADI96-02]RPK62764.1 putative ABC transporter ATP-binding protein YxlF [Streptomyces sp. ADI96-02]